VQQVQKGENVGKQEEEKEKQLPKRKAKKTKLLSKRKRDLETDQHNLKMQTCFMLNRSFCSDDRFSTIQLNIDRLDYSDR
jgi:hypothetical protein